jgi:acetyltransferase-like isoleucine patch superfamily enzyme
MQGYLLRIFGPMTYEFNGYRPVVHPTAFVHPQATVTGNVIIGAHVYIGPGAALRGDWGEIIVADGCNIQENCTIHMFPGVTVRSGGGRSHRPRRRDPWCPGGTQLPGGYERGAHGQRGARRGVYRRGIVIPTVPIPFGLRRQVIVGNPAQDQ